MNHISSLLTKDGELSNDSDLEGTFKPDLSNFSIDDLTLIFREKFKKIRIFLSVRKIDNTNDNNPLDFGSESEYYCRIILKDTQSGMRHFLLNRKNIDPIKRYTFVIRNDETKKQRKLDDFYAICVLPNMKVRISFDQIYIHEPVNV